MTFNIRLLLLLSIALCTAASWSPVNQQILRSDQYHDRYHLNFSSPSPLIFHSVFSLLQQWPNTFFPNGHTIAPCTVPINTKLYHAHQNASFPDSPEWFAFDSAMAYSILGGLQDSHLLTFRTTREIRCLYFDGTSAALMDDGSMDSQMLVIHNSSADIPDSPPWRGPPPPGKYRHGPKHGHRPDYPPPGGNWTHFDPLRAEYDRAEGLCKFISDKDLGGPGWGYEGIVRMNAAFEMIWCNFSSPSIELVSWLNVSAPVYGGIDGVGGLMRGSNEPDGPPRGGLRRPPGWDNLFRSRSAYEWFHAAANTYGFVGGRPGKGEARVEIDGCGVFSFYTSALRDHSRARIAREQDMFNLSRTGEWHAPENEDDRQLALQRLARRRRYQRATNVSEADGQCMRSTLEHSMKAAIDGHGNTCSRIDWSLTAETIVTQYSSTLHELDTLLSQPIDSRNSTAVRNWLTFLRGAGHQLLMPYYEYPQYTRQTMSSAFSHNARQSRDALLRCRSQHDLSTNQQMTSSEHLISSSISSILDAICRTILPLFLSIEAMWLTHFNNISDPIPPISSSLRAEISTATTYHRHAIEELMAWLGWVEQWVDCEPGCSLGRICAIPIWPVMGVGHFSSGSFGFESPEEAEEDLFRPRCIDATTAHTVWN